MFNGCSIWQGLGKLLDMGSFQMFIQRCLTVPLWADNKSEEKWENNEAEMTDPPPLTPRLRCVSDFLEQTHPMAARLLAGGADHLMIQGDQQLRLRVLGFWSGRLGDVFRDDLNFLI